MDSSAEGLRPEYEDVSLHSRLTAELAQQYLDVNGNIDYTRFDYQALATMQTGPGFVIHPTQMDRCDIGTSTSEFARESNNFHTIFNNTWGAGKKSRAYFERFTILFPELAHALDAQYQIYSERCISNRRYSPDPEMFEPLRVAYGIMAQLVDAHDVHYKDQRVCDLDEPGQTLWG